MLYYKSWKVGEEFIHTLSLIRPQTLIFCKGEKLKFSLPASSWLLVLVIYYWGI